VPPIAVTGATGRLGRRVANRLAAAGEEQRLVVRDPSRAPDLANAAIARAEYADADDVRNALSGVEVALMVSGSESVDRVERHRTFIDAARDAGVRHLVYTSFYGASPDATFTLVRDHWATEEHIRASGMAFTILRDNLYADFVPLMMDDEGVIRGPAGEGRAAVVAQDDIADVAAAVLLNPDAHASACYDLTGPESLTMTELAAIASDALGREVRFVNETIDEAYASRAKYNAPSWQVDAWVTTYTAIAAGELDGVSSAIPDITGHPATSLADLLRR
jgi:NAD(P)H dehydrogenase (quinone)